jgi:hypothetical protein
LEPSCVRDSPTSALLQMFQVGTGHRRGAVLPVMFGKERRGLVAGSVTMRGTESQELSSGGKAMDRLLLPIFELPPKVHCTERLAAQ